ncbi:hypothetical protein DFH09DRAFT_924599, partial [Mycena vulgaris]
YLTAIACADKTLYPAELRVYSPPGNLTLPDSMVVFTITKALFPLAPVPPNTGFTILEAVHFAPCPGDPNSPDYQVHLNPYPFLTFLGNVCPTLLFPSSPDWAMFLEPNKFFPMHHMFFLSKWVITLGTQTKPVV